MAHGTTAQLTESSRECRDVTGIPEEAWSSASALMIQHSEPQELVSLTKAVQTNDSQRYTSLNIAHVCTEHVHVLCSPVQRVHLAVDFNGKTKAGAYNTASIACLTVSCMHCSKPLMRFHIFKWQVKACAAC